MLQPEVQHHGYLLLPNEPYFAGRIGGEAFWWIYQVIGFFFRMSCTKIALIFVHAFYLFVLGWIIILNV